MLKPHFDQIQVPDSQFFADKKNAGKRPQRVWGQEVNVPDTTVAMEQ